MVSKEISPFSPGKPVPVEYFIGRKKELEKVERALRAAAAGGNANMFITGERGIGKSSLADVARVVAEEKHQFIGAHCYLGPVRSLEEVCSLIFQRLLQEIKEESVFDKAGKALGRYIRNVEVGFFGLGVRVDLTTDALQLRDLCLNFLPNLKTLLAAAEKRGVILIMDDLNGVATIPQFANFVKSTVDELASQTSRLPLILLLVGIPERMTDLTRIQPSVGRIFDVVELSLMSEPESGEFFQKAFDSVHMTVEADAKGLLVRLSGGHPVIMHEVGDAVFWSDSDGTVDVADVALGVFDAAENVGRKYLDRQVYREIRSETYLSILRKLSEFTGSVIKRTEVLQGMTESEQRNFDNFRVRMSNLGMLKGGKRRGQYLFANDLFRLYFWMEAQRAKGLPTP